MMSDTVVDEAASVSLSHVLCILITNSSLLIPDSDVMLLLISVGFIIISSFMFECVSMALHSSMHLLKNERRGATTSLDRLSEREMLSFFLDLLFL